MLFKNTVFNKTLKIKQKKNKKRVKINERK